MDQNSSPFKNCAVQLLIILNNNGLFDGLHFLIKVHSPIESVKKPDVSYGPSSFWCLSYFL